MRKVLFYTGSLASGGAERQLIYTALSAQLNGYKVLIVIDHDHCDYTKMLEGTNIEIYCTHSNKYNPIKRYIKLNGIIQEFKPEIFHSFLANKNLWGMLLAYLNKVPIKIASIRNTNSSAFKGIQFYNKWADKIICNSRFAYEIAHSTYGVPRKKLEVIYNCIDMDRFNNTMISLDIKHNLGLLDNTKLGITVARFSKQKNHLGFVKAFSNFVGENSSVCLHHLFVGNQKDIKIVQPVRATVDTLNLSENITFWDTREDIPEIIKACDFLILPSLYEGFPNVVMEAMASKTFVIATAVGGIPELVKHMENGILIPSPRAKDIAKSIELYLSLSAEKKERIINQAYIDIQSYGIENMFRQTEELYTVFNFSIG